MGLQKFCSQELGFKDKNWFLKHDAGFGAKTNNNVMLLSCSKGGIYRIRVWFQTSYFGFVCVGPDKIFWRAIISVTWSTTRSEPMDAIYLETGFPSLLLQWQQVNCFFVNGPWPPLDLGQGGSRVPNPSPKGGRIWQIRPPWSFS